MRLPFRKMYRAFPELDGFSDRECREYVARATETHQLVMLGTAGALIVVFTGLLLLGFVVWNEIERSVTRVCPPVLSAMVQGGLLIGPGATLTLVTRDWVMRALVRRAINTSRCPRCGYSLLGLRATGPVLTCPECGNQLRLTPADVNEQGMVIAVSSAAG